MLLDSKFTVKTKRAAYAIFYPKLLSEAIQGSSALQQIWEVILLMTWLKADLLWVAKVDFQGMILWIKQAELVL